MLWTKGHAETGSGDDDVPNMVFTGNGLVRLESVTLTDPPSFLATDWWLELFVLPQTVTYDSTVTDFTLATFSGYSRISLERALFTLAVIAPVEQSVCVYDSPPAFACDGGTPQTAYGWVMIDKDLGEVTAGQNFASGRVMSRGATLVLDPFKIRMRSIPPGA